MKGQYNPNVHASLLGAVGAYLLYLAWTLLEAYRSGTEEMPPFWNLVAVIVFALGGLGTFCYAWAIYRKGREKGKENRDEEEPDDQ